LGRGFMRAFSALFSRPQPNESKIG
jgi:hypothetical protein